MPLETLSITSITTPVKKIFKNVFFKKNLFKFNLGRKDKPKKTGSDGSKMAPF